MMNIAFDDIPFLMIQPQRFTSVQVDLDRCNVSKPSLVQTE